MDAISFGTDGWRAPLSEFTSERVRAVGQAVATYLDDAGVEGAVAVGYDARETSPGFATDLAEVLTANGRDVLLAARDCPTPTVAWAVADRDLAGALMVTASHNPAAYNGVKFIPEDGAPALPDVTEAIEARLAAPADGPSDGEVTETDFLPGHADHVLDLVDADLSGLTVAYDAMHGSGREATPALLERAGADVVRLRCDEDPTFGGAPPEPSADHLGDLIATVRDGDADVGVANDGDADRVAVVTPERGYLDENRFFAALYDHLLGSRSGPAVRTVSTTFLIDRIAEAHGEEVVETKVGFKWVARAMAEHDALVGGEESGGFSVRGHVREKDGVLAALYAAAMATDGLDERVDALLATHGEIYQDKVSLDCPDDRKAAVVGALGDRIPEDVAGAAVADVNTVDGFKLQLADGSWLLVRPSGTEPKMRVYAEAGDEDRVAALLDAGHDLVAPLIDDK